VAFLWAAAWNLLASAPEVRAPDGHALGLADRATIAFGAATIALILVSLLVGTIAIFEWQKLDETIRLAVTKGLIPIDRKTQGRVFSSIGFALGELSTEPDQHECLNRDHLSEAIRNCQKGYDLLKEVDEREPALMALNNLIYYSCIYGEESKGLYLLNKARELRDAGSELRSSTLLLTFCRAVLRYGTKRGEIDEAREIAGYVANDHRITDQQRREAKFYITALDSKLGR
jgi:hypothetical protein